MSEANTQGSRNDVGSSATPGISSSSGQASDHQASIRDSHIPMKPPKRGGVMKKFFSDVTKTGSPNSPTA